MSFAAELSRLSFGPELDNEPVGRVSFDSCLAVAAPAAAEPTAAAAVVAAVVREPFDRKRSSSSFDLAAAADS